MFSFCLEDSVTRSCDYLAYFEPTPEEVNRKTAENGSALAIQVSELLGGCYGHTMKV
jgi:hypothetical protein